MAITITHPFVSAKGDGTDATLVRPSNWNAAHAMSMATGNLIGRLTAGAGTFEEIPISAFMASILNATDALALAGLLGVYTTGDVVWTFKSLAPAGWILMNQPFSIGNVGSGASYSNTNLLPLYQLIYANVVDADAPVSGGRSGNSLTDFNANKIMTPPSLVGRSPVGAGSVGPQTSARTLGRLYGEENHTQTLAETPSGINSTVIAYPNGNPGNFVPVNSTGWTFASVFSGAAAIVPSSLAGATIVGTNQVQGTAASNNTGGQPHNNMHPVVGLNVMVKL